jgi:hypothetical protein
MQGGFGKGMRARPNHLFIAGSRRCRFAARQS